MRRSNICKVLVALLVLGSLSSIPIDGRHLSDEINPPSAVDGNNTTALGWVSPFGGPLMDYLVDSLVYENGTTVSAGWFQGNLRFPNSADPIGAIGGSDDFDFFIVWIDENGSVNSAINGGSTGFDTIDGIALMPNGDLVVAGNYCLNSDDGQCQLGLGDLMPLQKTDDGDGGNVFLARLDSNGSWVWSTQIQNPNELSVLDVMVSTSNEIHFGVLFQGVLEFNGSDIVGSDVPNLLIATYGENGQVLSHRTAEADYGIENSGALCMDGTGQMYVAVTHRGSFHIEGYDLDAFGSTDMSVASFSEFGWNWAISAGGVGAERAWDCDGKITSGIHVVGEFSGNASFGSMFTSQSNNVDFFISEVSPTGGWVDLNHAGGSGIDRVTSVIHSQQGSTYIAGSSSAELTLGEYILQDLDGVNDNSYNDVFLAELLTNGSWGWVVQAGGDGNDEPTDLSLGIDGSPLLSFVFSDTFEAGLTSTSSEGSYDVGVWLYQTDLDNDGVLDGEDNCARISNADQTNLDNDLQGDVCDEDDDNDGIIDENDDCPRGDANWFSEASTDHDRDGCKDATEDYDDDEDTVFDQNDLCPLGPVGWISTLEEDAEGDGCADIDTDSDGWVDQMDNCPNEANPEQLDLDSDNIGNVCDIDEDGDGVANPTDNCLGDSTGWTSTYINDHDQDGCHDSLTDFDDDEDGVGDADDSCPRGEVRWASNTSIPDYDGDGCRDFNEDEDDDDDGVPDTIDNCQTGIIGPAAPGQDLDGDGCIDSVEDLDDDGDGVLDTNDLCLRTTLGQQVGITGCSQYQLDDDLDGIPNAIDLCQNTEAGKNVDLAGCHIASENSATDGVSSKDGVSMSSILYFLAALLLSGAVFVTLRTNQPKTESPSQPPPRPKDFPEIENDISASTEEE